MSALLAFTLALGVVVGDDVELQRHLAELGLSRAQEISIRDLTDEARALQARTRADIELGEIELRRELEREPPDAQKVGALIDRLSALEGQARKQQVLGALKMRAVLTKAQRERLEQLRSKRADPLGTKDAYGTLSVNSQPWAKIYLDGIDSGRSTPQANWRLPAGNHTLTLVAGDHREVVRFSLKPGEEIRIIKQLE